MAMYNWSSCIIDWADLTLDVLEEGEGGGEDLVRAPMSTP